MVDEQLWNPDIKVLTAFTSIHSNLDRNLDWTTELENVYHGQARV
jgi:hypothetical protein